MTTNRDQTVNTAAGAIGDAGVIDAVRTSGDDRVIASVRAARDAYAALHGHDVAAIFEDVRAAQEASGRTYVRDVERLVQAATPVAAQVTAAVRQMERSLGPVLDRLNEWAAAAAPFLEKFREWNRVVDALNEVGWLPYRSAPVHYVEECGEDLALLDSRFADYYRTRWSEIRADMESRLANYHIDDEARATFNEALSAHEAGLYRCVCRLLFPEIERMIGAGRDGSRRMLEELTGTGDLSDFAFKERFGYVLFGRLVNHAYERVMTDEEVARFEQDPVPNRHAAMHGLVAYSTHKHSMNMLILTDYVFRILPPLEWPESRASDRGQTTMLLRKRFGFYPHPLNIRAGPISISPLPDLGENAKVLAASGQVEGDWIYASPQPETHFPSGGERILPYPARVFGLPETHLIQHANATGDDHLDFHLWALSLFVGVRLTATEAGFLDATPFKKGALVDFFLPGRNLDHAVELAERFWQNHRPGRSTNEEVADRPRLFEAAVHALFLAQNPRLLEFESFVYLYMALDACFRLTALSRKPPNNLGHAGRIQWMCKQFGAEPPPWGAKQDGPRARSEVAEIRNDTFHEALFMGSPLGFASRTEGGDQNRNLTLEMRALTCRFLVALIVTGSGMVDPSDAESDTRAWADYVRSPVNARATHRLVLTQLIHERSDSEVT